MKEPREIANELWIKVLHYPVSKNSPNTNHCIDNVYTRKIIVEAINSERQDRQELVDELERLRLEATLGNIPFKEAVKLKKDRLSLLKIIGGLVDSLKRINEEDIHIYPIENQPRCSVCFNEDDNNVCFINEAELALTSIPKELMDEINLKEVKK